MRTPTRVRKTLISRTSLPLPSHCQATRSRLHKTPRPALVVARHDLCGSAACCLPLSTTTSMLACAHNDQPAYAFHLLSKATPLSADINDFAR